MTSLEKKPILDPFTAILNANGIVELDWNTEVLEITKDHLISIRTHLKKMGGGKKLPLYVDSHEFIPISAEARNYTSTIESAEYTLANAIKIDTLAKKIIFNFLVRFMHPKVPTKAFSTKEEAIEWLMQVKKASASDI